MPKVSIICASYNHEKYVRAFIESVLAQTDPDWELIIVDDYSKDRNVAAIEEFDDARIHLVRHAWNQGINQGLMDAFRLSKAPIIQISGSDDLMLPDNVETLCEVFDDPSVDIVCAPLSYMDAEGKDLGMSRPLPVEFSHDELLAELIFGEDCMPSPGMALRRDCYASIMPLDVSFLQLQDWQVNLRLVARYAVRMLERPLVRYRVGHAGMTSAPSPAVVLRREAEMFRLMDTANELLSRDVELFMRCIGGRIGLTGWMVKAEDVPFLMARQAVMSSDSGRRAWGLQKILECLSTEAGAQTLHERFGFAYSDYMSLVARLADGGSSASGDDGTARLEKKIKRYRHRLRLALAGLFVLGGIVLWQIALKLIVV